MSYLVFNLVKFVVQSNELISSFEIPIIGYFNKVKKFLRQNISGDVFGQKYYLCDTPSG